MCSVSADVVDGLAVCTVLAVCTAGVPVVSYWVHRALVRAWVRMVRLQMHYLRMESYR